MLILLLFVVTIVSPFVLRDRPIIDRALAVANWVLASFIALFIALFWADGGLQWAMRILVPLAIGLLAASAVRAVVRLRSISAPVGEPPYR